MGSLIHQLWLYMRTRKKFWLLPTLIMAAVVGAFVTVTKGTAVAPFIYAIFLSASLMRVLVLSAFYHDSAAALVVDGTIAAAAQEERFTRKKNDAEFPRAAVAYCLEAGGVELDEVDQVVFYDKPLLKFERLIETYQAFAPKGLSSFRTALPIWLREKLFQERLLRDELRRFAPGFKPAGKLVFAEHHQSHAASAFFPSPFDEAVILTMDGVGEWATTTVGFGRGNQIEIVREIHFPHSLGLLYSAFTYYLGSSSTISSTSSPTAHSASIRATSIIAPDCG